jgi:hypothetical protein
MTASCERPQRRAFLIALGVLAAAPVRSAPAERADSARLIVELIVFRQPRAGPGAAPEASEAPRLPGGAEVLPATSLQLGKLESGLKRRGYAVLGHGACLIPVPPGSTQGVRLEDLLPGAGLTGRVSVTRGQNLFLHVEATAAGADGSVAALNERRRVKYGERHYLDGEVLGAIATVTPLRGGATP